MNCHSLFVWAIGMSALGAIDCGGRSALDSSEPLTSTPANSVGGAYHTSTSTTATTAAGGHAVQDSATIRTVPVTGGSSNTGGTDAMTGGTSAVTDCAPPASGLTKESLIDDMENGSGRILDTDGRLGVWYAFDSGGSTQWPAPTTPGVPIETSSIPSGRCMSQRAMHTYGAAVDSRWAGIGFDLNFDGITYGSYDASAYDGITFWAHGTPENIDARISTIATTSTKYGGTCTLDDPQVNEGCQPHYRTVYLGDDFGQYWIPFNQLTPSYNSGTGNTSAPFEKSSLTNIQFYVAGQFDFWIDNVSFYSVSPSCCSSSPTECSGIIEFSSSDLKTRIGKGNLSCADVCYLETLYYSATAAPASPKSLEGLQCLISLNVLSIINYSVSDIAALAGLTRLRGLYLSKNRISNLQVLSNLVRLKYLDLSHNAASDVSPLAPLTNLLTLNLSNNDIRSVDGLSSLTRLTSLQLSKNQIGSVSPLAALSALTTLDLSGNSVVDSSALSTLTALTTLNLSDNQVVDVSDLSGLTQLTALDLTRNRVLDVSPLSSLVNLVSLKLPNNQIRDLANFGNLPSLDSLDLSDNEIHSTIGMLPLDKLWILDLPNNAIDDLSGLAELSGLAYLDLNGNRISDASPLSKLTRLFRLNLKGNQLTDLTPFLSFAWDTQARYAPELDVSQNPIDCVAQAETIQALRKMPVTLTIDCP
jgi:Leucine-rich repeat (LRR) protein